MFRGIAIGTPSVGTARKAGFALPIVVFVLVMLGLIGSAALQRSHDEVLSAEAVNFSNQAFYAAEAGINNAVAGWDQSVLHPLIPGDSLVDSWTTIANGCSYQVVYRRIDGGDAGDRIYSVESTGRSPGLNGRRKTGIVVRSNTGINSALTFGGDLQVGGNPTITGACPDIHTNGDLDIGGAATVATVAGIVTTSGTAFIGGTLQDTLGNSLSPVEGVPQRPIPKLDPDDFCDEADYIFVGQWGTEVSTMTTRNLNTGTWWGWKWGGSKYVTDNDNVAPGVYCMNNDVEIGNQLGTPSTPLSITILTTASITVPGDPYIVPAHSDSILLLAEGDLKLNGSPSGGDVNFEGLAYAGAQCEVSGTPRWHGQLICRDDPNPVDSENYASNNKISGDLQLSYSCGGILAGRGPAPINGRTWSHIW